MDGLLTAISTTRTNGKENENGLVQELRVETKKETPKFNGQAKPPSSPEDALDVLRHQPDYDLLLATLRFLVPQDQPDAAVFSIKRPSPLSAQLVQVLVSEIVPNYWTLLKEGSHGIKKPDLQLLLSCIRSITGINAVLVRLRALIQEAKSEAGKTKRPDIPLNLSILVDLLSRILEGDDCVLEIWRSTTTALDSPAKLKTLAHEIVAMFGSGRIVSLAAEADEHSKSSQTGRISEIVWPAGGLRYTDWLGRNIAKWLQSETTPEQTKLCSDLFSKAMRLGHSDSLVKLLLSKLVLTQGADPQLFRHLLDNLSQTEQRKVLLTVLSILAEQHLTLLGLCESEESKTVISAAAGALNHIVGADKNRRIHLVDWLTNFSGAALGEGVAIRRAVLAVLAQERDDIVSVLEKSINQFGDQLYVKHAPMLQQDAHAQVLLLSAGYVHRKSPLKLNLLTRSSPWLNTVSNRLGSSNQRARFLGMVVGEGISSLVNKADTRLDFNLEETKDAEGQWYKALVNVNDPIGSLTPLLAAQKGTGNPAPEKRARKPAPPKAPQQGFIIEELSDEEMVDEDDIIPYGKPDSDAEDSDDDPTLIRRDKPKAPVYIRNLIQYLRDTDSYDHQKLALTTAPALIRRKANFGTEVAEHTKELATLLVGLQDKYEIDNFDDLRLQGMIAIVVAQPQTMGKWFAKTFFDGDYSVSQRASVLIVLGLAGRELAGFETSEYATAASFPSKTLPEQVERLFIGQDPSVYRQSTSSSLKSLPPNALENAASSLTQQFLEPMAASAADAATGPDILKLSTFTSRLAEKQNHQDDAAISGPSNVKIKSRAKPRVRAIPNTTAQLLCTSFFSPLAARFQAALHAPNSRSRGIVFQPYLLALYLKTLALLLHAAGPSTLALPQMTAELWRLLLSTSVRAQAVGDFGVTQAVLFGLMAILDVNEDRMRDVCQELGKEVVETQEWVAGVFQGLRGGDRSEEEQVKMLAAGVLVRLREGIEKYRLLLVGDLIGFT